MNLFIKLGVLDQSVGFFLYINKTKTFASFHKKR